MEADIARISENAQALTLVPEARAGCPPAADGTIVVCAKDHSARYRVPPGDEASTDTGALAAPVFKPIYGVDCNRSLGFCARMKAGYAPPPIYYIDLGKIPLPPPGSDAEKIAKGEMRAP